MLEFSANARNHFKEKDILILLKNLKLKNDFIDIDILIDLILSEWPDGIEKLEWGKLGKRSRFKIFKWNEEFNKIADAFLDNITK